MPTNLVQSPQPHHGCLPVLQGLTVYCIIRVLQCTANSESAVFDAAAQRLRILCFACVSLCGGPPAQWPVKPSVADQAQHLCCLSLSLCPVQSGPNTIAPGSQTISVEEGTVVAVAWLPENSTALFAWRGSVSKKDWLADFQLWWGLCLTICTYPFVFAARILTSLVPSSADRSAPHSKWK